MDKGIKKFSFLQQKKIIIKNTSYKLLLHPPPFLCYSLALYAVMPLYNIPTSFSQNKYTHSWCNFSRIQFFFLLAFKSYEAIKSAHTNIPT